MIPKSTSKCYSDSFTAIQPPTIYHAMLVVIADKPVRNVVSFLRHVIDPSVNCISVVFWRAVDVDVVNHHEVEWNVSASATKRVSVVLLHALKSCVSFPHKNSRVTTMVSLVLLQQLTPLVHHVVGLFLILRVDVVQVASLR
jgi:hypothetical protein